MSEICREPIILKHGDDMLSCFDENHSINDVLRWLASENGADEVALLASQLAEFPMK